jgi:hypothetical protein
VIPILSSVKSARQKPSVILSICFPLVHSPLGWLYRFQKETAAEAGVAGAAGVALEEEENSGSAHASAHIELSLSRQFHTKNP